ncbi:ferritin-like domain-containing protein [Limnobacter parvus]|uniref:Ferritin-like domain-containing protein n=1 Tax=Limnobacter parvus TaxID=2939690 RepID=A0ABT1XIB9_9BURK|nr:ferritin-like domain-containing protein [Limnobacter parvus]MCR2746634.1 ferritin-like domain-containing protein [Limnobacter parvus]
MRSEQEHTLRHAALQALECKNAVDKVHLVHCIDEQLPLGVHLQFESTVGRPDQPELVHPARVPTRKVSQPEGRGMLLHSLAHIEFNAINLALDLLVRFSNMPAQFYADWLKVAKEEAYHHTLLCERLAAYNLEYGDYLAHDGLWQMAEKTKGSLLARLALVPRLLEARGLDVSPAIREKLAAAGDTESAEVLDIILRDEIGHVAIGNRWFNEVCNNEERDPIEAFEYCLREYTAPQPRSPFNFKARAQAGFSEEELAWLMQVELEQSAQ